MSGKAKPAPPAPQQQQSYDISNSLGQQKQILLGAAGGAVQQEQGGYSPYLAGSDHMSAFRQNLTNSLANSTANTGANALANMKMRAQAAGFGSNSQPITFGAENEMRNQQAQRIADIPAQVEAQAAPLELQAAQGMGNSVGQLTNIGNAYNPEYYYGQGSQFAQDQYQNYLDQIIQTQKNKAALWGALIGSGKTAATAGMGG